MKYLAIFVTLIAVSSAVERSASDIAVIVTESLNAHSKNFTNYELVQTRVNLTDPYYEITFDLQNATGLWEVDVPIKKKSLYKSAIEVNFPVTLPYFYINGTLRGSQNSSVSFFSGDFIAYLNGVFTVDVRIIYKTKKNVLLVDTNVRPQRLNFVTHIEWYNCSEKNKILCQQVSDGIFKKMLPTKLTNELKDRVRQLIYNKRHGFGRRINFN